MNEWKRMEKQMLLFSLFWAQSPFSLGVPVLFLDTDRARLPDPSPPGRETDPGLTQMWELHSPVANWDIWNLKARFLWLHQSLFLSYGSTGQ